MTTLLSAAPLFDQHDPHDLLTTIRSGVRTRECLVVAEWAAVVRWAEAHVVTIPEHAATVRDGVIDTGVPIAGDGAPLISDHHLSELVAALGRSPNAGRAFVGRVVECAWRLPKVYAAVAAGRLAPWRAERISDLTRPLNAEATVFVDGALHDVTSCTWAQVERLVEEAVARHDPVAAEARRQRAADRRRLNVEPPDAAGTVEVHGLLDAGDGHDLEEAVRRRAALLGRLGNDAPLDVRRSIAVGEIARQDLTLDLEARDDDGRTVRVPGREVVLNVHLTGDPDNPVARWEEGACPISADQVREWLRLTGASVVVRPVVDLAEHVPVDSYEIPERLRTRVELRDHSCRFPHCTTRTDRCDLDHATPHRDGGPTCPCNLVPLCRQHHRATTFTAWRYLALSPGSYLWRSPHDLLFVVDHHGTRPVDTGRPIPPGSWACAVGSEAGRSDAA
ncbi:HNH endonuclease signature motif containing protein [Nocardioides sp. QY071]|uniref:HNH endonuclease signature motif containing protein n=1 Tax=Nocardioides sp. QY071 TaxID=3044187 RepID=UPI00249CD727|nr:HNH endonuclease signature motif containing protein [Nocardioides sp. QY071]WGY03487.1 HNH endonuclease signature motif containing protein [Nocardioides sp. QY071]